MEVPSSSESLLPTPQQPQNQPKFKYKKALFLFSYLSAIPFFIVILMLFSLSVKYEGNGYVSRQQHKPQFQAVPGASAVSTIQVESEDGREEALNEFFAEYNSPLEGHARTIIEEADAHNIDYRLLPAIAMQESTLCKKVISGSNNCWGFGIYGGKVTRFTDYDHAIRTITATLAKKYVAKGYETPSEIVRKYTPSDTGKWEDTVNMIMTRLKNEI
jgi:hypothetical protein